MFYPLFQSPSSPLPLNSCSVLNVSRNYRLCSVFNLWNLIFHRRRIYTEKKAKVVPASWGHTVSASIPCWNSYFAPGRVSWRIGLFATYLSTRPGANQPILRIILVQNSKGGKELKKFFPPKSSDDLCHVFCTNPSSMAVEKEGCEVWNVDWSTVGTILDRIKHIYLTDNYQAVGWELFFLLQTHSSHLHLSPISTQDKN